MLPHLRLHPGQVADLAEIRDISPDLLAAIAARFQTAKPHAMRPAEMHRELVHVLGEKSEAANRIMRPLLAFQAIIHQRKLSADEVMEAVRRGIESSEPAWEAGELARWNQVESLFKQLLVSPVVRLVSPTLDLMDAHENLLQSTRVVTDIRPVFSEDAGRIEGGVTSFILRLRCDSTEGDHSLTVALDEVDLRELARQCQQALLQAPTERTVVVEQAKLPIGSSSNGEVPSRTVLEEFLGFVDQMDEEVAHVTLKTSTGEVLHGEYPAAELRARGIRESRQFKCRTIEVDSRVEFELESFPDREISEERQRAIEEKIQQAFGDADDPQDDY